MGGIQGLVQNAVMALSVAAGNVAGRERDRALRTRHADGRPKALGERAAARASAMIGEGASKIAVAQVAHLGARELAKRVPQETLKRVLGVLGKSPLLAASTALFAFDTARDGVRFARGDIGGSEFGERVSGNAVGLAGSAGGAYIGSFVGTLAMPIVGTAIGSLVGGVIGGIGGDAVGRTQMRKWIGGESGVQADDDMLDDALLAGDDLDDDTSDDDESDDA